MTLPDTTQESARAEAQVTIRTPYYVRALGLGVSAYLVGVHLWSWVFMGSVLLAGACDFRALYASGYTLRTGGTFTNSMITTSRANYNAH